MSHLTSRAAYQSLADRLNRFPQGAPPLGPAVRHPAAALQRARGRARRAASHPARSPSRLPPAAGRCPTPTRSRRSTRWPTAPSSWTSRARTARRSYVLPPPMAGFFEFSMMRLRGDIDQKLLAELFYQYMNVEDDFIRALFLDGETQLGRVFVDERQLPAELSLHVLDYERASEVVRSGVVHRRRLVLLPPQDAARRAGLRRAARHLHDVQQHRARRWSGTAPRARSRRRVPRPARAGTRRGASCSSARTSARRSTSSATAAAAAARRSSPPAASASSTRSTAPTISRRSTASGATAAASAWMPARSRRWRSCRPTTRPGRDVRPRAWKKRCASAAASASGTCERAGPSAARASRPRHHAAQLDAQGRADGDRARKLQNLIFDNQALLSHRALAAILGVILRLPPVRRAMASRQLRSRYLERLIARYA